MTPERGLFVKPAELPVACDDPATGRGYFPGSAHCVVPKTDSKEEAPMKRVTPCAALWWLWTRLRRGRLHGCNWHPIGSLISPGAVHEGSSQHHGCDTESQWASCHDLSLVPRLL